MTKKRANKEQKAVRKIREADGDCDVNQAVFPCCLCDQCDCERDSLTAICDDCIEAAWDFYKKEPECASACSTGCPGWLISETHGSQYGDGEEIEKCDECGKFKYDEDAFGSVKERMRHFVERWPHPHKAITAAMTAREQRR